MLKPNKPAVSPLVANGVTKRFHQGSSTVEALRNVSLEFQEAESVAVMGASGSGKSTLRHAMGGLTSTDSGEVLVEGQLLAGLSGAKLTDFPPKAHRLYLPAVQLDSRPDGGRARAAAATRRERSRSQANAGTRHLASRTIGTPSSHGPSPRRHEQRRTTTRRHCPGWSPIPRSCWPTSILDSIDGKALRTLLKELNEGDGRTIVVVTHEPAVAVLAKRVVVMKDGSICADFPATEFADAHELAALYQEIVAVSTTEAAV